MARARMNPIRRLCRNWPATESGWPGLSSCHPTLQIAGRAVFSAGAMGAIIVKRPDNEPSTLGSERIERITSVGGRMLWYQE